jgi:hypothetical protein
MRLQLDLAAQVRGHLLEGLDQIVADARAFRGPSTRGGARSWHTAQARAVLMESRRPTLGGSRPFCRRHCSAS